jgi:hypothetical protein
MSRFGIPVIAGIILIIAGFNHGWRSDRWGDHPDALEAAGKLSKVPATIEKWHSSEVPLNQREIIMAGALGYLSRKYALQDDGRTIFVTILCGRHGPISVHPPTVCFVGAGWELNDSPDKYSLQAGEPPQHKEFWLADFQRNSEGIKHTMRTFWAWSVSGDWQAADHPRITYANSPFLYKIYITYAIAEANEPIDGTTKTFIERLLTEVDHTLLERGADL